MSKNLDASKLPDYSYEFKSPLWWGIIGLVTVEGTVVATLIASFFYLQGNHAAWPPAGTNPPELLLPTLSTLVLLASMVPVYLTDKAFKSGNPEPLGRLPLFSILLALIFLAIKAYEYGGHIDFRWDTHAYGSVVWLMIGFHSAHVIAVILKTLVIVYLARKHYFTPEKRIAVTVNGLYWYFVAAAWIPLYLTIYWGSRIWG
ncbi:cytochrome c oxidase subunit 3 [Methylobacillus caricis]|uniref:cytochrome c oxidase subunit 3 n=1 Tax=Methylobacillus caricis TaxID=1971611 RepID=UPI001CFFB2B5|nr:cytochrome c oxidase subunit 3 [Methylobacillus caricis]MCB5187502.1 cytochrome c oxidase subunit 3 [Methylobacillus caricis]